MNRALKKRVDEALALEQLHKAAWHALVNDLVAEIERLEKQHREEIRQWQREVHEAARDAAAEERWRVEEEQRYGGY